MFQLVKEKEMAKVYRRLEAGGPESRDATRRVYILTEIAKVITFTELQTGIDQLEQR